MKIRQSFVSNSSSSSFVCEICGHSDSGWDFNIKDVGMVQSLEGESVYCEEHINVEDVGKFIKCVVSGNASNDLSCKMMQIEHNFEELEKDSESMSDHDLGEKYFEDILDIFRFEIPQELCPISNLQEIPDHTILHYLLMKTNTTISDVINEIKDKFTSYSKLNEYIFRDKE